MAVKIITVLLAMLVGAGAVIGFQAVTDKTAEPEKTMLEQRLQGLEGQLASLNSELQTRSESQQAAESDVAALTQRINGVDKQLSAVLERQAQAPAASVQQLTGEEIVRALKALPADDRETIRQTMRQGEHRPLSKSGVGGANKAKLEQEIGEGISKLNSMLELNPVQLDEIKTDEERRCCAEHD